MIKHYTAHAANERTYLAWVRTSIAIMIFGFLVEKFAVLERYLLKISDSKPVFEASQSASFVGGFLISLGCVIVVSASARFFIYKRLIDKIEPQSYGVGVKNISLALSFIFMVIALLSLAYITQQLMLPA
jgi:putative membrane protein